MRIIHILNHLDRCNGHVNVAVDLACVQTRLGHSVWVISRGGALAQVLAANGVEHITIDQTRHPLTILRALLALRKTVRSRQPDIIHAHMMTGALLSFLIKPFAQFKLVTTVHNEFEKSAIMMGLGDGVVAVSTAVAESMRRRGVAPAKLRVILNGVVGTPRLSATAPAAAELEHPAILFVGGLHPRKGVDDLISAFAQAAKISSAHLYLVGGGPYEKTYRSLAASTGISERIHFCGGKDDPRPYYLGADIFVLASLAEPGGLALAEARAAGCAIVATAVDGSPEMLDYGVAGMLVPPRRPDLLAAELRRLLDDPAALHDMRRRAASNHKNFHVERATLDYLAHYQELMTGLPSPRSIAFNPSPDSARLGQPALSGN